MANKGKPKADERTEEMVKEEMKGRKFGGKVQGRAVGGRLDRRARGGQVAKAEGGSVPARARGGMTPKSPLSGADVKKMPYESNVKGVDCGGKGNTIRP
jgi:hypothetical protein